MLSVTDFVRKGIISGVRVQAGLHLDMLDADRSPNMQSAFLPELHRWISQLTARHLHACPPGDLLNDVLAGAVISTILSHLQPQTCNWIHVVSNCKFVAGDERELWKRRSFDHHGKGNGNFV